MDYFLCLEEPLFSHRPKVKGWSEKFSVQDLYKGDYSKIPNRVLLEIEEDRDVDFVDILSVPFLMVSKKVKKVMEAYEPNLKFKEIVLLEKKHGKVGEFYLPLLKSKEALIYGSSRKPYKMWEQSIISKEKVGDTAVFYVDGVDRKAGIWREDILESILARYAYGFQIKKIEAL